MLLCASSSGRTTPAVRRTPHTVPRNARYCWSELSPSLYVPTLTHGLSDGDTMEPADTENVLADPLTSMVSVLLPSCVQRT